MKYPLIHHKIFSEPWLLEEAAYNSVRQTFLAHCGMSAIMENMGEPMVSVPERMSFLDEHGVSHPQDESRLYNHIGSTAIVPMHGIVGKMLSGLEMMCGGCDIDTFLAGLDSAMAAPDIENIILHQHTPGGTAVGVPEAAARVAHHVSANTKEIISFTETQSCSAGYYIGSQAHRFIAAPSSVVGSIGAVATIETQVGKDAADGLVYTTFTSGRLKDLGNPHRAMTSEEKELMSTRIQLLGHEFAEAVASGRGLKVEDVKALEAGYFRGTEALELRLIDGLAANVAEVLQLL